MSNYQGNIIIKNPATPTGPFENGSAPGVWTLSEAMTFKRQGIWPTQGVQSSDAYFKYVSLLLSTTALGNANNNLFVDSSGAFNPISRNGNTTQGSMTPYGANWSAYLDNSGDYLTTGSGSSAFAFGTGDFTIEGWFYANAAVANWKPMLSVGAAAQGQLIRINQGLQFTGNWGMLYPNDAGNSDVYFDTGSPFPLNQWVHVALVRNGTTLTLYQNGVNVLQKTVGFNFTNTTGVSIGYGQYSGDGVFGGYVSNVRIVKGTAVYTSNFTPSTAPLTAISGTSLLTCQSNRFIDNSSNTFAITRVGDTRVTDFSPFSSGSPGITYNQSDITNWSGYFDGSGDYLDVPNSTAFDQNTAFTVEMWVYPTVSSTDDYIYSQATNNFFQIATNSSGFVVIDKSAVGFQVTSSAALAVGVWTHIAMVSNGSTISLYINGTSQGSASVGTTATSATTTRIGAYQATGGLAFTGYISNLRVVKGTAVYTGNFTPATTNLTAISGTSLLTLQNAAFTDNSTNSFVITPNGNVTVTGNSPFNTVGYWSNYFDGSGDYLNLSNKITFGTGDFTVEGWVYRLANTSIYDGVFSLEGTNGDWNSGGGGIAIACGNLHLAGYGNINYSSSIPLNQWTHIACSRSGTSVKVFLNGSEVASATSSTSLGGTAGKFPIIGGFDTLGGNSPRFPLTGFISNLRTVTGTALYTSNFTPPTAPLTAISGTSLLTCQNGRFIDNSTNAFAITVNGNTSIQSFDPFYTSTIASNGGSMYFDGSGDYLLTPYSGNTIFGSANFTFEAWIYPTTTSSTCTVAALNNTTSGGAYCAVRIDYTGSTQSASMLISNAANSWQIISGTSSNVVRANSWSHIAVVRNGSSFTLYVNGVSSATGTYSGSINSYGAGDYIGAVWNGSAIEQPFFGYISNLRLVKGTAVYTSAFTPPTAPVTPTPATTLLVNGMNAGIYDATAINNMETVGNAQVTTAVSKFGGSSVYFDGNGDYLHFPYPVEFFTPTSWTLEGWVYINSLASAVGIFGYSDLLITRITSTAIRIEYRNNPSSPVWMTNESSYTFSTGTWYHIAFVLNNGSFRTYVDGTAVGSASTGVGAGAKGGTGPQKLIIGATDQSPFDSVDTFLNGYMDDVRITSGVARYTANFTPPTNPFQLY